MRKKKNDTVLSLQFTMYDKIEMYIILDEFRDYFNSAEHLKALKKYVRYRYPASIENCIEIRMNISEINKHCGVFYMFTDKNTFVFQLLRLDKDTNEEMDNTKHLKIFCVNIAKHFAVSISPKLY